MPGAALLFQVKLFPMLIRASVFIGIFVLGGLSVYLMRHTVPFEIQTLLSPSNPVRIQYERDQQIFNDEASAWLVVERDQAFAPDEMSLLSERIGRFFESNQGIESVLGPHNAEFPEFPKGALHLTPFIEDGKWTSRAKEKLDSEVWHSNLVRPDETAFLIGFRFADHLTRPEEKPLIDRLERFLSALKHEHPGLRTGLLGAKIASAAFLGEMQYQQRVITPLLLLAIGLFLFLCYRSWQILIWNFFVMFICYALTLCLIILVEGGLGPYSSFALMFAFIVATTDLIHFFSRYQQLDGTPEERLQKTLQIAAVPCLLTSLTTAAGFFALIINQNLPIRYFGLYCAFSCILEWLVIFYLLPPVLRAFRFHPRHFRVQIENGIKPFRRFLERSAKGIAAISFLFIVIFGFSSFRLQIDDNFYTKFVSSHPLSRSIDLFSKGFQFVGSIDLILKPRNSDFLKTTDFSEIKKIEREIESDLHVARISSLRQVNEDLSSEMPKNLSANQADQLRYSILGLFNDYGGIRSAFHEPSGELRTEIFLKSLATQDLNAVLSHIEKLKEKYKDQIEVRAGGFSVLRSYINGRVIDDFFQSFFLSFFLIFLCYLWLYRSWKWALLGLLPNALPLVTISGLMSLFQVPVDTNLVILICVAFGISGDNTVHLSYVLRQEQKAGLGYDQALEKALRLIGIAMVATSGIFLFCLPVFLLGHLKLFSHIAIFLSTAFLAAFLADVVVFPALQICFKFRK